MADAHLRSEPMGPTPHIHWMQYRCPCMLCYRFCVMASNDGYASQVCHSVSVHVSLVLPMPCTGRSMPCETCPPSRRDRSVAATRAHPSPSPSESLLSKAKIPTLTTSSVHLLLSFPSVLNQGSWKLICARDTLVGL